LEPTKSDKSLSVHRQQSSQPLQPLRQRWSNLSPALLTFFFGHKKQSSPKPLSNVNKCLQETLPNPFRRKQRKRKRFEQDEKDTTPGVSSEDPATVRVKIRIDQDERSTPLVATKTLQTSRIKPPPESAPTNVVPWDADKYLPLAPPGLEPPELPEIAFWLQQGRLRLPRFPWTFVDDHCSPSAAQYMDAFRYKTSYPGNRLHCIMGKAKVAQFRAFRQTLMEHGVFEPRTSTTTHKQAAPQVTDTTTFLPESIASDSTVTVATLPFDPTKYSPPPPELSVEFQELAYWLAHNPSHRWNFVEQHMSQRLADYYHTVHGRVLTQNKLRALVGKPGSDKRKAFDDYKESLKLNWASHGATLETDVKESSNQEGESSATEESKYSQRDEEDQDLVQEQEDKSTDETVEDQTSTTTSDENSAPLNENVVPKSDSSLKDDPPQQEEVGRVDTVAIKGKRN
jgi:hypothetical protein